MKFHFDFHFHFHGLPPHAVAPAEVSADLPAPVSHARDEAGAGGNQSAAAPLPPGDAADQGGPSPPAASETGPPTLTTDEWLEKLKIAAQSGMAFLQNTWERVPVQQRRILKFELEKIKPIANDADQRKARIRG